MPQKLVTGEQPPPSDNVTKNDTSHLSKWCCILAIYLATLIFPNSGKVKPDKIDYQTQELGLSVFSILKRKFTIWIIELFSYIDEWCFFYPSCFDERKFCIWTAQRPNLQSLDFSFSFWYLIKLVNQRYFPFFPHWICALLAKLGQT